MARFNEGQKVIYVPDHADGPGHKDAEVGVVKQAGPGNKYFVDYNDRSGVAKLTYERNLIPAND